MSMTEEWIKKMWCIHTMEYYLVMKKSEIMPFVATWMDLEVIILDEVVRQSHILYIIYMFNLKNNANKLKYL